MLSFVIVVALGGFMAHLKNLFIVLSLVVVGSWEVSPAIAQSLVGDQAQDGESLPEIRNPGGIIPRYTVTTIGALLTEMEIKWTTARASDGKKIIAAEVYGLRMFFLPGRCSENSDANCTDLHMLTTFSGTALSPANIIRFNNDYVFGYVGVSGRDDAFIRRYDFERNGFTRGHLEEAIYAFWIYTDTFLKAFKLNLTYDNQTSSLRGQDTPALGLLAGNGDFDGPSATEKLGVLSAANQPSDITSLVEQILQSEQFVNRVHRQE